MTNENPQVVAGERRAPHDDKCESAVHADGYTHCQCAHRAAAASRAGGARELIKMREANALIDKAEGADAYHMAMIALALVTRQYLRTLEEHADAARPRSAPGRCDCGAPATQCYSCAVGDWQAAHPHCSECCPIQARSEAGSSPVESQGRQYRCGGYTETQMQHARVQENANGFQNGWHAALTRVADGTDTQELRELVPDPALSSPGAAEPSNKETQ